MQDPKQAPATNPAPDPAQDAARLAELLVHLGPEVVAPLAQALERLQQQLAATAPGASAPLLALRDPLRRARDATVLASQVGRLASGRVRPGQEACPLHVVLNQVVELRRREAQNRGLQLRLDARDANVISDPGLLPSLLHALLDWALWHTRSSIELNLSISAWPPQARLQCRFALRDLDQEGSVQPLTLNGLRWMLVEHTANALKVQIKRQDEAGLCVTQLDFPLLRSETLPDLAPSEPSAGHDTQPFAGWLALVASPTPDFHKRVSELLGPLGWAIDAVHSIDEAFQHCLQALPQCIVVDGGMSGPDLTQWRSHVLADAPSFCFVEMHQSTAELAQKPNSGLHCNAGTMADDLPGLLLAALAPRSDTGLTFRL
jgi:CheY-like chemotaxis protein